jgi:hypothetical protein
MTAQRLTRANWITIAGLMLGLLGAGAAVAKTVFYLKASGEVLEERLDNHRINQAHTDDMQQDFNKSVKQDMREFRVEQKTMSENIIRIGERVGARKLDKGE